MKLENVAYVGEQLKDQVAEVVEMTKELPEKIKKGYDVAAKNVVKGYRRTKAATEEVVDDTRRGIKNQPFTAVGIAAVAGIGVGVLTTWLVVRKRR
jgi:ElaB/YqjD/DUF883 family membrane-anchored ribosome-binding protein